MVFQPARFIAEIGVPLPPTAQHGNIRPVFPHPGQGQLHQLFHVALAPGLGMNADRAHVAGLQFELPYAHHAGQSGDHAANALLVHRQQMMFRAVPLFGVFLGDQGLKIRFFAVHGKNHAAEKRQRSLFLRPCDAIFRHKRSSLQKGLFQ